MLGFCNLPHPHTLISSSILSSSSFSTLSRPFPILLRNPFTPSSSPLKTFQISLKHTRFKTFAANNSNGLNNGGKAVEEETNGSNGINGGDDLKKDRRPIFNIRWVELLLDPDPDNLLAVALTGLLTWASVQVLWQLFFISLAILVAALKYSFIAALLIFILITLL